MITIKNGKISTKTIVVISCVFHQVIEVEELSWKLHIPRTIYRRYQEVPLENPDPVDCLKDIEIELYPDDEEGIEDYRKGRMAKYYSSNFFYWNITIKIKSQSPITKVINPYHEIETNFLDSNNQESVTTLKEIESKHLLKKGFSFIQKYRVQQTYNPGTTKSDKFIMMLSF